MKTTKLCFGAINLSMRHGKQLLLCLPLAGMLLATSHVNAANKAWEKSNEWVYGNVKKVGSADDRKTTTLFEYTIPTSTTVTTDEYAATGGTVSFSTEKKVDANGYKLDKDFGKASYVMVSLSGNSLHAGDIISITAYSSTKGKGGFVAYTGTTTDAKSVSLGNMSAKEETVSYTVTADDCLNGMNKFYVYRKPSEATYVKEINISRQESEEQSKVVYDFSTLVGTTTSYHANIKIKEASIMLGTDFKAKEGKYITIKANEGESFKAGDVVTVKGKCAKATSGVLLYSDVADEAPMFKSPAFLADETEYTYTLQKDCDSLSLGRYGSSSTYITYLNVVRPASSGKVRLTAGFAKYGEVVENKTESYTVAVPQLTVYAGDTELEDSEYTVEYTSNNESIAAIANTHAKYRAAGTSTIFATVKSAGVATILATVKPTDAETYDGCAATYILTVKDPTPLTVSVANVKINVTDATYKQPVIKVYDDNNLLTLGTDYTLSYTVDGDKNVSVDADGTFSVSGKAYAWTKGTSKITVTATPLSTTTGIYTAGTFEFQYNVVEGKLTPEFLPSFTTTDEAIKVKKYDSTIKNTKSFVVPLIYDGEDVSEYFTYTYTIDGTDASNSKKNKIEGNKLTIQPTEAGEHTIVVSATPSTNGSDDYSDVYNTPASYTFKINVDENFIIPTVVFNPDSYQMLAGSIEGMPEVNVTYGTNALAENAYTAKWTSLTPSFVRVDETTGKIEAVSEGIGVVSFTITGDNLETVESNFMVYVDDPAVYRTREKDNKGTAVTYGNQKVMWNENKTMAATLGGWMFPNDVDNATYTDEGLKSSYYWADNATLPKWKLTGFDRYVSSEMNKNARQENGSNAMPNSTFVSTRDFKTKTGTIVDKMFNVPCSGSYIVLNPVTNGTVDVHIFQNGVFDSGQYRPQRRVFVMDEAGNFVQSTPSIENANGKPTGGLNTLDSFTWDINPNGSNVAPTDIDVVKGHFKNIADDFDLSTDKFKNNVLECNLSNDLVRNDAYDENIPGSNGWCVLADSPVTYSFKVKAGKTYYLYNFGSKIGFYGYSFKEDDVKPVVDEKEYNDDQANEIVSTANGHVAKVTVNRTLKAGIWGTCVLPFSLNKYQVDAIFGNTYSIGNEEGTQILYFDHVDSNGKVWFVRHAYNTIVANKPFLIKPTKDVERISTADVADYPYVTIEAPENGKPADWCKSSDYAWVSSYSNDMTLATGDGYIGATSGNFLIAKKDGAVVKGFRGYLKGLTDKTKTQVLKVATSSNTDVDGTTFIDGVKTDADVNIIDTSANDGVYNMNGQLVGEGVKGINKLPRGAYIINGKKYIK